MGSPQTFLLLGTFVFASLSATVAAQQSAAVPGELTTASSHFVSTPRDHIFFAGDNEVTLFINGRKIAKTTAWENIGYADLYVGPGDVIALEAKDAGSWYGVAAQLSIRGRRIVTGRDDWRASRAFSSPDNAWMRPAYSACGWDRPQIRSLDLNYENGKGKSRYFPRPSAARYVWAAGAGEKDTIFLRYRVGGESCTSRAVVSFAGDNIVTMYVNGVVKATTNDWSVTRSVNVLLKKGDVVAFKAVDLGVWYGMIATISLKNKYLSTGVSEWRATPAFSIAGNEHAWTLPWYNACAWSKARVLPGPGVLVPGKSQSFPYSASGAKYIWANGAGEKGTIFVRAVIGEQC